MEVKTLFKAFDWDVVSAKTHTASTDTRPDLSRFLGILIPYFYPNEQLNFSLAEEHLPYWQPIY